MPRIAHMPLAIAFQECRAVLVGISVVLQLDISHIECGHAAVRRLLRGQTQSHAQDLGQASASFILMKQRIWERCTPEKPEKPPRSRKKIKGGMAQRAFFSQMLRKHWKAGTPTNRKRLFSELNTEFNAIKLARSNEFEELQRIGEMGKEARAAGGCAFGPTQRSKSRCRLDDVSVQALSDSVTTTDVLPATSSILPLECEPDMTLEKARDVYKHAEKCLTQRGEELERACAEWQSSAVVPPTGLMLQQDSRPLPCDAGIDVLEYVAPGRKIMQRALSDRRRWKRKGRKAEDLHFRNTLLEAWRQRHRPHLHAAIPTLANAKGWSMTTCMQAGFCVCGRAGQSLRSFVAGFQSMLARNLERGSQPRHFYDLAALLLRIKAPEMPGHWFHIAWGNLQSRVYTLAPLCVSQVAKRVAETQAVNRSSVPLCIDPMVPEAMCVNMWAALRDLDHSLIYSVSFFRLAATSARTVGFAPAEHIVAEPLHIDDTFSMIVRRRHHAGRRPRERRERPPRERPPGPLHREPLPLPPLPAPPPDPAPIELPPEDQEVAAESEPDSDLADAADGELPAPPVGEIEEDVIEALDEAARDMEAWDVAGHDGDDDVWDFDCEFGGEEADAADERAPVPVGGDAGPPAEDPPDARVEGLGGLGAGAPAPAPAPEAPPAAASSSSGDSGAPAPAPDPEAPPPPPPPAAADAPGRGWGGGGRLHLPRYNIADELGCFRHDIERNNLNIHCLLPGHGQFCRMNRTLKSSDAPSRAAQGRSIGMQLAWFMAARDHPHEFPDRASHAALATRSGRGSPHLSLERRTAWREWGMAQPSLGGIFDLERNPRPGEGLEPAGIT